MRELWDGGGREFEHTRIEGPVGRYRSKGSNRGIPLELFEVETADAAEGDVAARA
jgi:hypothetical protein